MCKKISDYEKENFKGIDASNDIHTFLQYHGYQNVFGDSYSSFTIENDNE